MTTLTSSDIINTLDPDMVKCHCGNWMVKDTPYPEDPMCHECWLKNEMLISPFYSNNKESSND